MNAKVAEKCHIPYNHISCHKIVFSFTVQNICTSAQPYDGLQFTDAIQINKHTGLGHKGHNIC